MWGTDWKFKLLFTNNLYGINSKCSASRNIEQEWCQWCENILWFFCHFCVLRFSKVIIYRKSFEFLTESSKENVTRAAFLVVQRKSLYSDLSIRLSDCLSVYQSVCPSIYPSEAKRLKLIKTIQFGDFYYIWQKGTMKLLQIVM